MTLTTAAQRAGGISSSCCCPNLAHEDLTSRPYACEAQAWYDMVDMTVPQYLGRMEGKSSES